MEYGGFQSQVFRSQVKKALKDIKTILDSTRRPQLAEKVDHQYDDKFALVEYLTNTAIAAQWNILERMGLTEDVLMELREHTRQNRSVTMRFEAEDSCELLKEASVDVVMSEQKHDSGITSPSLKVVTKVKECHWRVGLTYRLVVFAGSDPTMNRTTFETRSSSTRVISTGAKKTILPPLTEHAPLDVNLTWLVQKIAVDSNQNKRDTTKSSFHIDRDSGKCKTPVRNEDVRSALDMFQSIAQWSSKVVNHFKKRIEHQVLARHQPSAVKKNQSRNLDSVDGSSVFCPVLPLLEKVKDLGSERTPVRIRSEARANSRLDFISAKNSEASPVLKLDDVDHFLKEQIRSLDEALQGLSRTFVPHQLVKLITIKEASLVMLCITTADLFSSYTNSIFYIEEMVKKQLTKAIGRVLRPRDFDGYMAFHLTNLLRSEYGPKPFSHSVRRLQNSPDGEISIEQQDYGGGLSVPIQTTVRRLSLDSSLPPIDIPINTTTRLSITGERFLHGWVLHRFESVPTPSFKLVSRARQFSSFVVMVGVMGSENQFNPKEAIVIQNKDEVFVPLLLSDLPSGKEFQDAISSLSPEQQRFAEAFRSMQLESKVFGVCIIQVKPQLELLLGLPIGTLTKEIRLTQDLMSLFVDYQIPSDMVSFDGEEDATSKVKVDTVRSHVRCVLDMIEETKESNRKHAAAMARFDHFGQGAKYFRDADLVRLKAQIEAHDRRERYLEKKITSIVRQAKDMMSKGDKKGALFSIKRKKLYESELAKKQNSKMAIEAELVCLERTANLGLDVVPNSGGREDSDSMIGSIAIMHPEQWLQDEDEVIDELQGLMDNTNRATSVPCLFTPNSTAGLVSTLNSHQEAQDLQKLELELAGMDTNAQKAPAESVRDENDLLRELIAMESHSDIGATLCMPAPRSNAISGPQTASLGDRETDDLRMLEQELAGLETNVPKATSTAAIPQSHRMNKTADAGPNVDDQPNVERDAGVSNTNEATIRGLPVDVTSIAKKLDSAIMDRDSGNSMRLSIIETEKTWLRRRQDNLRSISQESMMGAEDLQMEKNRALDLLDALSRSGLHNISYAELHVIVAVAHRFENTLIGTVVQDNIDPIEKVERSALLMASTIFGEAESSLVKSEHRPPWMGNM